MFREPQFEKNCSTAMESFSFHSGFLAFVGLQHKKNTLLNSVTMV